MRRIMYLENKNDSLDGDARIGWAELSKSKRGYHYAGRLLLKCGGGYKYNCVDSESGERYWISGPHRDGADKLYGGVVKIDEDARVEYWSNIRERIDLVQLTEYRAGSSTRTGQAKVHPSRAAQGRR